MRFEAEDVSGLEWVQSSPAADPFMEGVRVARHCNNKVINNPVSGETLVGGEEAYWRRMTQSQLKEPTSHLYILHVFVPYLSVQLYLINQTFDLCLSLISVKDPMLF